MIVNSEGIVLRQRKIANNRRMIVIFTKRYGKLSAGTSINEKSRGKAALALRPFTYAEYDIFKGRDTYSINSASVQKSFYSIGEELARFDAASVFIEYLDKVLAEGEPQPKLFDLSLQFLESAAVSEKYCETLLYAFIYKSLRLLGVAPEIGCCVNCGRSLDSFGRPAGSENRVESGESSAGGNSGRSVDIIRSFSVTSGGIICEDCESSEKSAGNSLIYRPSFAIIDVFRYFDAKPLRTFERAGLRPEAAEEMRAVLADYIDRYLGTDVLKTDLLGSYLHNA